MNVPITPIIHQLLRTILGSNSRSITFDLDRLVFIPYSEFGSDFDFVKWVWTGFISFDIRSSPRHYAIIPRFLSTAYGSAYCLAYTYYSHESGLAVLLERRPFTEK